MKTLQNLKKYTAGFVIGVAVVSSVAYGASNGSIGALFTNTSGVWTLRGEHITNGSISSQKLVDNSVTTTKLANNSVTQAKVSGGYVDRSTSQSIGGTKTFTSPVYGTAFLYSSDERFKDNIQTIQNPLETVQALRGVTWDWKKDGKSDVGFIAQEVEEVLPQLVSTKDDGYKAVQYANIVGVLVEAIKEQQKQIDVLTQKVEALEIK